MAEPEPRTHVQPSLSPMPCPSAPLEVLPPEGMSDLAVRIYRGLVRLERVEDVAHTLHLFGSAGIAAFGWAICRLLGVPAVEWVPLWFCAGLLVFNMDRLRADPADALNAPRRTEVARRWRFASRLLALGGGLLLFVIPIVQRDWGTLALIVLATPICLHYSIPFRGKRLKDVPYLKSFFAPTLVIAAIIALPLLKTPDAFPMLATPLIIAWAWGLALANMLLCDLRDVAGDQQTGVMSLPAAMGLPATRRLIVSLATLTGALAALLVFVSQNSARGAWIVLAVVPTIYIDALALAVGSPRSERFFERWVEGILFLPAIVVAFFL